jgi:hypothetical protein
MNLAWFKSTLLEPDAEILDDAVLFSIIIDAKTRICHSPTGSCFSNKIVVRQNKINIHGLLGHMLCWLLDSSALILISHTSRRDHHNRVSCCFIQILL